MKIPAIKEQITFYLIIVLFALILAVGAFVYLGLGQSAPVSSEETDVEVNLPIIEWAKYLNLSKKYETDIFDFE